MRYAGFLIPGLALGLALSGPAGAAPTWKSGKPAAAEAKLKAGKTVKAFPSPDRGSELLARDEGEQGDFAWQSVYLRQGKRYTLLDTYNEVKSATWTKDGGTVTFQATKAVGPDRMEVHEVEYRPARRALRWRVLRSMRVESSL